MNQFLLRHWVRTTSSLGALAELDRPDARTQWRSRNWFMDPPMGRSRVVRG